MKFEEMNPLVQELLQEGAMFFQCCKYLHLRGMGESVKKVEEIVPKLKEQGYTYEQLENEVEALCGEKPTDQYFAGIKHVWNGQAFSLAMLENEL